MIKLEMKNYNMILTEKQQKKSALLSGKIDKNGCQQTKKSCHLIKTTYSSIVYIFTSP